MIQKSVLITGCSSGIGLSSAKILFANGWRVFATARDDNDLKMLSNLGFISIYLDLLSSRSIKACVDYIAHKYDGNIDAVINNAGFGMPGAIEDLSRDSIKNQFEVNVFGALDLTSQLIPYLCKKTKGRIVYISSLVGRLSLPFMGIYSASKFAIEAIADAQRVELSMTSVKVVLVEPGPIGTKFSSSCASYGEKILQNSESRFTNLYKNYFEKRRNGRMAEDVFRLPPDAVAYKILHALESKNPKVRYKVTIPAYIADLVARFFPNRLQDFIIKKQILRRFGS